MIVECLWHMPVAEWNRLQHAIYGNGSNHDGEPLDFGDEDFDHLGDVDADEMIELEVFVEGHVRCIPLIVLWHADDGGASAAVPAWACGEGATIAVAAASSGGDAPLPRGAEVLVRFVQLSAEMMSRTQPATDRIAAWDTRFPLAWPRGDGVIAAGASLVDAPPARTAAKRLVVGLRLLRLPPQVPVSWLEAVVPDRGP